MAGALHADEFGHVFKVLAENVLIAFCEDRDGTWAEPEKLLLPCWTVQYVNRDEVNAFFRKKLFRSKATTSTGLGKEDKIFTAIFHYRVSSNQRPN